MCPVNCLFCDANLPPKELVEGWCETCGKKLPASLRGPGAAGSGPSGEPVPARSLPVLRFGLGVLGILAGLHCFAIGLSDLPTILRKGSDDPAEAAGRLTGALCCSGLPFVLGLCALLKKERPRNPRTRDHWNQAELPSRKPFPLARLILGLVIGLALVAGAAFLSAIISSRSRATTAAAVVGDGTILKSNDGSIQIQVPAGWSLTTDLNARAELQIRSPKRDVGLVILTELKTDFRTGMTYREHSELTRNAFMKKVSDAKIVRGPTDLVIHARPALQCEIHGLDKDSRFAALHTTIDGRDSFHQVLITTTPSLLERNRTTFQEILNSITEIK
jgi:hypothetical protein